MSGSGLFVMRKTATGSCKVGQTRNGGGPAPATVFGHTIGACGNLASKDEKRAFNKMLHAGGLKMLHCDDERISAWDRADGVAYEIEHLPAGTGFWARLG